MPTFKTLVTDVGQRKITEATMNGGKINIIEAAVGDGNGNYYIPTTSQIELKRETWRGEIAFKQINAENRKIIDVKVIIPADVGNFTVREAGLFDDEGDMIVICNTPSTEKVTAIAGSASTLTLFMHIIFSNMDVVNIKVEPTIDVMTHDEVEAMIEMEAKARESGDNILAANIEEETAKRQVADEQLKKDFAAALEEFSNSIIKEIVIPKTGWQDAGDGGYQNDVYMAEAKHQHFPIVSIDLGDMDTARAAEMSPAVEATDLSVRFRAQRVPDNDIHVTVALLFPQRDGSSSGGGGEGGGGSGTNEYILPVATSEQLGGIKTGRGLNTTLDGTTSVNMDDGYIATDEEVTELLDKYFPEN